MYCTICGNKLDLKFIDKEGEIPFCKGCNKLFFPKVDIAMIAILTNEKNQICLINQKELSKYKVLLAGFIQPGETLEDCVKREIFEEVGIEITHCNYIRSYHYEKKDILMTGFHALTKQHNLKINETEIDNAKWYNYDDAIGRMKEGSIAYLLVREFLAKL